jgi:hypothetical protein
MMTSGQASSTSAPSGRSATTQPASPPGFDPPRAPRAWCQYPGLQSTVATTGPCGSGPGLTRSTTGLSAELRLSVTCLAVSRKLSTSNLMRAAPTEWPWQWLDFGGRARTIEGDESGRSKSEVRSAAGSGPGFEGSRGRVEDLGRTRCWTGAVEARSRPEAGVKECIDQGAVTSAACLLQPACGRW